MQIRPELAEVFTLKQRFNGKGSLGKREFWVQTGNYLDFGGSRNKPHRHSFYEVCLVLEGRGRFSHGEEAYELSRGDLFIADPGIVHEIISHPRDHLRIQFIAFSFDDSLPYGSLQDGSIDSFLKKHRTLIRDCERLEQLFILLKEASLETDPAIRHIRSVSTLSLIIQEFILVSAEELDDNADELFPDSRVQSALQYMRDNVFRRLTVEEIASHAGASPRSLRRLIKEKYGVTVAQKCFALRIESAARHLISHPGESIAQISADYGFENPSDFCRGFKKVTGTSPGRYRKNKGTVFI